MLYVYDNRYIQFIHIPRTGGRCIVNCLSNRKLLRHSKYNGDELIFGKQLVHATYDVQDQIISKIGINKDLLTRFTVVRNPVDKFISGFEPIYSYFKSINHDIKVLEDYDVFLKFMEEDLFNYHIGNSGNSNIHYPILIIGMKNYTTNWFEYQSNYLSDDVSIWKFEDGFGDNFKQWLLEITNIDFSGIQFDRSYKREIFDMIPKSEIKKTVSDKIKENIARYYENDFAVLGY